MMTANEIVAVFTASKRKINDDQDQEPIRKKKYSIERFTSPGNYDDEIIMLFDDGKKLYVSKNFLRHISPVFYVMFETNSQCVENETKIIKMVDKSYDNVQTLLMHLDPMLQREVNRTNVFEIVHLAEEYMIRNTIRKCRHCLMNLLEKGEDAYLSYFTETSTDIVAVLLTASTYGYKDIQERAIKVISKWRCFGSHWPECYARIPDGDKLKILEYRLIDKDDKLVTAGKDSDAAKVP